MTPYLLIDFGTTSTKAALVDLDSGSFSRIQRYAAIPNAAAPAGHHEVPPDAIQQRFLAICTDYWQGVAFHGIVLSAEMHGFVILDGNDKPLTNYISWKDERSTQSIDGKDTFSLVSQSLGPRFKEIVGMHPRPGFPLLNLTHLLRTTFLPPDARVVSLPGWLALCSSDSLQRGHATTLVAMTFYDVHSNQPSDALTTLVRDITGQTFRLDEVAADGAVSGHLHIDGKKVPIFAGVGDHQCSVLGAGNTPGETISLNLGTGSQVGRINAAIERDDIELRPYFGNDTLAAVTHLPAGRALNDYIGILDEVAAAAGAPKADFWSMLADLNEDEVLQAKLDFNLSTFQSARHYRDGGHIARIEEGSFTLPHYLASLLKSFATQYLEIIEQLDPQHQAQRCILSGGIAQNLPLLHRLIAHLSQRQALDATALDESFLGLRTLALIAAGRTDNYLDAQHTFGRQCRIEENPT
jgi:sedoheptulokinase